MVSQILLVPLFHEPLSRVCMIVLRWPVVCFLVEVLLGVVVELWQISVALKDVHVLVVLLIGLDEPIISEYATSCAELSWLSKLLI